MSFTDFLALVNVIGLLASGPVYLARARFHETGHNWREYALPNLLWMLMTFGKVMVWWAVLAFWLVRGAPASPWRAVAQDAQGRQVRAIVRVGN